MARTPARLAVARVVLLATALTSVTACNALAPVPSGDFVARDGAELSGVVDVHSFYVPSGCDVSVASDFDLRVEGVVRIDGRLIARDAAGTKRLDAPSITITSPVAVDIPGEVLGGRGASPKPAMREGGRGSDVTIRAPFVYVDGSVRGGEGGEAGPGHPGGHGGDVRVEGYCSVRKSIEGHSSLVGGKGGAGGFPGGGGGNGGDAIASVPERVRAEADALRPIAEAALKAAGAAPLR